MKKILTIIILTVVLLNSCSDDFLSLSNPSALSPSVFPANISDMETVVTSIYAQMTQKGLFGADVYSKGVFPSDHTVDMSWTSDATWNQFANNNLTSDNTNNLEYWYGFYKMISCANTVLEDVDAFDTINMSTANHLRLSQMKGEALFWRGWAHQQLVTLWGEGFPCNGDGEKQGVPIRLKVASSPTELNISRSTVSEVYSQILKDYQSALSLLPKKWNATSDYPRPTYYAVESFIGQLYLYMGDNANAKTALKDVISNSGKTLASQSDYANMFDEKQTKFNNESILEVNFKNGNSASYWWNGEGSKYALIAALSYEGKDGSTLSAGWGNIYFHDSNIKRFGSDPRLSVVALAPGTPVVMGSRNTVVVKYQNIESNYHGWSMGKYIPRDGIIGQSPYLGNCVGINMYLMRLADVYLMYAEASLGSDDVTALEYTNKVRRRAYNLPIDAPSSIDLAASGVQLRDSLREERFKEFCGEGFQHLNDVFRWKTLSEEITKWYSKTRVGNPNTASPLYFPIPLVEIQNNPKMKQSNGYN